MTSPNPRIVEGDLLDQPVDVIVNAWNRNLIPWWLLIPCGVSGAIKRRGGIAPFRELAKHGMLRLGEAILTDAGRLPYQGIIHVAGINLLWRASEFSIRQSVANAVAITEKHGFRSVAYPIIGAGSGGFKQDLALDLMIDEFKKHSIQSEVVIVKYKKAVKE